MGGKSRKALEMSYGIEFCEHGVRRELGGPFHEVNIFSDRGCKLAISSEQYKKKTWPPSEPQVEVSATASWRSCSKFNAGFDANLGVVHSTK